MQYLILIRGIRIIPNVGTAAKEMSINVSVASESLCYYCHFLFIRFSNPASLSIASSVGFNQLRYHIA